MEQYSYTSTHPLGHTRPVTESLYLLPYYDQYYHHQHPYHIMQGIYNYTPETNQFLWYILLQLLCIYSLCCM